MQDNKPRPDKDARREAILDVACAIFLEDGFDAASMSAIAARVGGSKGTLYNYFKSKEELFEAFVERHCLMHAHLIDTLEAPGLGYRETLARWATQYLRIVTSDVTMRNYRVIMAVSERWPYIGRRFYENGPLRGAQRVAAFLTRAAAAGEFVIDDALLAAHQFIALCQSRYQKARFLNYLPEPADEDVAREVKAAIQMFYAAYAPRQAAAG